MSKIEAVCHHLSQVLPDKVILPNQAEYSAFKTSYFSQQEQELSPACVVTPSSTADVATAIQVLVAHDVPFAVRGGGHTLNAGAANIQSGITIDLRLLNQISLNEDQSVASVGGGATWDDVYSYLDQFGLAVAGSRDGQIGVGGLILGGGISYFSGTRGLVCDNVENFEVILATGEVVNANSEENRGLWIALKGGSGNFGIVTRFDLRTWRQDKFYGGVVVSSVETIDAQLQAFADLAADFDPHIAIILSVGWNQILRGSLAFSSLYYTGDNNDNPEAVRPFTQVQPQYLNTMRVASLKEFAVEMGKHSIPGARNQFATTTFRVRLALIEEVYHIWRQSVDTVSLIEGLNWALVFQPIPPAFLQAGEQQQQKQQGSNSKPNTSSNCLGLRSSDGPHVLLLLSYNWQKKDDDEIVTAAAQKFINDVDAASQRAGLFSPFRYLNYAAAWQDPIAGYGEESVRHLEDVSRRYDPMGVFQRLCPGGFKVFKTEREA
ncbi:hypothetical protein VTN77DRAFT_6367 [Rasamsonia byssochlamydoides]|uniref:uncharacterized protein n=1 Tax=Rasamsonia byssochlamydoides TaxID=89139 RepID=UPI0037441362